MKSITIILGSILIIFGISCFIFPGFTYTTQEQVAEIGPLKVTSEEDKTVPFNKIAGGISLAAGVVLIFIGRMKR